jgi:Uncharacterized conserved protein (COG2071)
MKLRTVVRDCLYLNWALPAAALPEPPAPLRYELHDFQGERYAFTSAVLFRQQGLRLAALPLVRLSYPQFNLRLYVLDGDGMPSVYFLRMLVPLWALPAAWLVRQPVAAARFDYPQPSRDGSEGSWRWSVAQAAALEVEARPAAPAVGAGPRFTSWEAAVHYFRHRPRGYARGHGRLRRVGTLHPQVAVWPMAAEIGDDALLRRSLAVDAWPALHSAFLCPEIPFAFELGTAPEAVFARARPPVAVDPAMLASAARRPRRAAA